MECSLGGIRRRKLDLTFSHDSSIHTSDCNSVSVWITLKNQAIVMSGIIGGISHMGSCMCKRNRSKISVSSRLMGVITKSKCEVKRLRIVFATEHSGSYCFFVSSCLFHSTLVSFCHSDIMFLPAVFRHDIYGKSCVLVIFGTWCITGSDITASDVVGLNCSGLWIEDTSLVFMGIYFFIASYLPDI